MTNYTIELNKELFALVDLFLNLEADPEDRVSALGGIFKFLLEKGQIREDFKAHYERLIQMYKERILTEGNGITMMDGGMRIITGKDREHKYTDIMCVDTQDGASHMFINSVASENCFVFELKVDKSGVTLF